MMDFLNTLPLGELTALLLTALGAAVYRLAREYTNETLARAAKSTFDELAPRAAEYAFERAGLKPYVGEPTPAELPKMREDAVRYIRKNAPKAVMNRLKPEDGELLDRVSVDINRISGAIARAHNSMK